MRKITFIIFCLLTVNFASAQLNSVAIVGNGAGGWPGDAGNPGPTDTNQMTSTDNILWSLDNVTLTSGAVKFRGNNSWDLPYNWGGTSFPTGTAIEDGAGIGTTAGVYNITFNSNTLEYAFVLVSASNLNAVSIVGDGAGGWPGDAGNPGPNDLHQMTSTDGINWTLDNLTLTTGSIKFRGNNAWDLPYIWGGTNFPNGTAVEDSPDNIPTTAGTYDVTFNSDTFVYNFTSKSLSVDKANTSNFVIYPNPIKDIINIQSNTAVSSLTLFDITGKKVFESKNVLSNKVAVGKLLPGVYIIRLIGANASTVIKKIVVK
ncbi:T9SS type A sorting domain-containing protein [Tamlana sp. I1]|uniref:T9SS type A sorting domain-containing protein n=1 Tax=Tamlana sp. I1 TaxID=2762061 RepID=UPI00188F45EC|nr:T9SS type A sorting domain-containing protein [Tamlana sp. I1]